MNKLYSIFVYMALTATFWITDINTLFAVTDIEQNANSYNISYTGFSDYDVKGHSFYIISGNNEISSNDLEFKEYAKLVAEILQMKGSVLTTDKENADYVVLMDYAIADESYIAQRSIPVWGQNGVSSITTTTRSNTNSNTYGSGNVYGSASTHGNTKTGSLKGSGSSNTNTQTRTTSTTTYTPTFGVTGYRTVSDRVSRFLRVMNLYAYDNKQREGDPIMLWKMNEKSIGSSNDLTAIIPHMIYGIKDHISESTNGEQNSNILENNYLYIQFRKNLLIDERYTYLPSVRETNSGRHFSADLVIREENETIVLIYKWGQLEPYYISQYTSLDYNGQRVTISRTENCDIDRYYNYEKGRRYMVLHFPIALPAGAEFDLTLFKNRKMTKSLMYWKGIKCN